jgi:hypothetical protein
MKLNLSVILKPSYMLFLFSTAAATFRQAVALVFDTVAAVESLPSGKAAATSLLSRVGSVTDSVTRSFHLSV